MPHKPDRDGGPQMWSAQMFNMGGQDKGVISMTEREMERRMAPLRLIEAYWAGLRAAGQVPLRSQVDPRGMESTLEYAFLGERIARGMAKLRVAGSHLSDVMGMDVSGMPLSTFIAVDDRDRFAQAVTQLFDDPAVITADLVAEKGFGKGGLTARLVLLPLRSDMGDVSRALGGLVSHGRIGRTPRRFRITSLRITPALDVTRDGPAPGRPALPATTPAAPVSSGTAATPKADPARGFSEPARPFEGATTKRPFIRLIVDND